MWREISYEQILKIIYQVINKKSYCNSRNLG